MSEESWPSPAGGAAGVGRSEPARLAATCVTGFSSAVCMAAEAATRAGEALLAARQRLSPDRYRAWLTECQVPLDVAERYVNLAWRMSGNRPSERLAMDVLFLLACPPNLDAVLEDRDRRARGENLTGGASLVLARLQALEQALPLLADAPVDGGLANRMADVADLIARLLAQQEGQ